MHLLEFPDSAAATASADISANAGSRLGVYYFREIYPRDVDFLLCDAEPVASTSTHWSLDQISKRFCVTKSIVRRGQIDGICMYFKATFEYDIAFQSPEAAKTNLG